MSVLKRLASHHALLRPDVEALVGRGRYLAVALLQVVQALRMSLFADVGFVDDQVLPSSLLSQEHTRVVAPQLWTHTHTLSHQPLSVGLEPS